MCVFFTVAQVVQMLVLFWFVLSVLSVLIIFIVFLLLRYGSYVCRADDVLIDYSKKILIQNVA